MSKRRVVSVSVTSVLFLLLLTFSWPSGHEVEVVRPTSNLDIEPAAAVTATNDKKPSAPVRKDTQADRPTAVAQGEGTVPSEEDHETFPDATVKSTTVATVTTTASGGSTPRLPNGGPNQHLTLSPTSLLSKFERPHHNYTYPFILDSFRLTVPEDVSSEVVAQLVSRGIGGGLSNALGRTRLTAFFEGPGLKQLFSTVDEWNKFLFDVAPSWFIAFDNLAPASGGDGQLTLKRRSKLFTFAITGGNDKRANYVEWTWGRRTPLQWYGDVWDETLRPIVDLHPQYTKNRFNFLTFKISRIWQRVGEDFGGPGTNYDWYVRLWDDNYFYEENLWNCLGRLDPGKPMLVGKIGWRYLADTAIYPFAGGGAGWFVSKAGMDSFVPSIPKAEEFFFKLRARKDIFLPHSIHDEDVFLTAWYHVINFTFVNIPGVEHVSPGMQGKQRCMAPSTLFKLRWDKNETIVFDYPAHEKQFRIEDAWYAFTKPIVWHYMSPKRLSRMETLLYPVRKGETMLKNIEGLPSTNSDIVKAKKKCYPGFTGEKEKITPTRGKSIFEIPLPDPPKDTSFLA